MASQGWGAVFLLGDLEVLHGRIKICTGLEFITPENVIEAVNLSLIEHMQNMADEEYLYWYRRGDQPILNRKKDIRPEINNKIREFHAEEICAFKDGYFLTKPATYKSRSDDETVTDKVRELNEYLYRSGKQMADNAVVDWFHTVGVGVIYVEPNDDSEVPVKAYALDPRQAFVVYSLRPGNKPIMGVNMVTVGEELYFDVYTETAVYKLHGGFRGKVLTDIPAEGLALSIDNILPNPLGEIPIIEYFYNTMRMGAFESVLDIMDAINTIQSNRVDGVEQFIQSLVVTTNVKFEDDVTANEIRKAGMINLTSVGENKADFQLLSEELNQTQTQVLVDHLYEQMLTICGMPNINKGHGSASNTTGLAILARDGWWLADSCARNTQDLFRESNQRFDRIFLKILNKKVNLGLKQTDFNLQFAEEETTNIQLKAQSYVTLIKGGLHPILALAKSGISNDPVNDFLMSKEYIDRVLNMGEYSLQAAGDTMGGQDQAVEGEESPVEGEDTSQGTHWVRGYWR